LDRQPEERVVIVAAHQTMLAPQGAPLPYDAEVEYLESTGTQYVDTGIVPDALTEVDAAFELFDVMTGRQIFGSRNSATDGIFAIQLQTASVATMRAGYGGVYYSASGVASGRQIAHMDNSGASLGSASIAYSNDLGVPLYPMFVLALNSGGVANIGSTRLRVSAFSISQSGALVRDYIPVRVGNGSTWEGAMMDVLTRRIYRNDGTGAFTYGNDLKYPIPAE
jgi:hypothetical protein